eukprot:TRINITY_DN522_c0_g1_i10.p1 TRINITY_DN522_c0_g1~~TRINITY_DN522_c0_g1_i10.p1  ORF type:complete len:411 (-),score=133.51 TRINITY_DN522_c0_g1_i10:149-1381(-)
MGCGQSSDETKKSQYSAPIEPPARQKLSAESKADSPTALNAQSPSPPEKAGAAESPVLEEREKEVKEEEMEKDEVKSEEEPKSEEVKKEKRKALEVVEESKKEDEISDAGASAMVSGKLKVVEVKDPSAFVSTYEHKAEKQNKIAKNNSGEERKRDKEEKRPLKEEKQAEFDKSLFKSSTTHRELSNTVSGILSRYSPSPDISSLNPMASKYYNYALSLHKTFEDLINDSRWKQSDKGKEWTGYSMGYEGYICSKSVGRLPGTPIEMLAYTSTSKYISDYNEIIKEILIIDQYPVNMKLMRMMGKGSTFVSARDFLVINHITLNGANGTIESVNGSVEDPRCPVDKKYVRAHMKIMGTRLIPTAAGETDVITISMADPKGSIPNMFKTSAGKQQSTRANLIAKGFRKRFP